MVGTRPSSRCSSRGSRGSTPMSTARSGSRASSRGGQSDADWWKETEGRTLPVMAAANMDAAFVEAVNSVLAPLDQKMQQVESDMLAADRQQDYDRAAELSEELEQFKSDFKTTKVNTLKRLLKESREWLHNESEAQKQALTEEFELHRTERDHEFMQQRAELADRHANEEGELKEQIFGLMHTKMKFSKQILEMQAVVKSLAVQKRYREAAEYKKMTDSASDKERAKANQDLVARAAAGPEMTRLLDRHKIEKASLDGRVDAEDRSHTDDLKDDLDRLSTQFRVAENILRDRYNFNCRAVSKGLDMLNMLPSLPITPVPRSLSTPNKSGSGGSWSGTPVSNLKRKEARQKRSGASRTSSRGAPQTTIEISAKDRVVSAEQPVSPGSEPGWGLPATGVACDWCGAPTSSMEYFIPAGDNRKCGHFCNWRCAKGWNQCRSPAQFRFVRDLRIDTLAKHEVVPAPLGWGKATAHQGSSNAPANTAGSTAE